MFTPAGQPIITSLLDTDVYKFSMWQVLWRRHPTLDAHYRFVCRNTPAFALPGTFRGTSSAHLARTLGLPAVGTMAHEYLQTYQALPGDLRDFQRRALADWWDEFGPTLAVALTDVVGMQAFLADFGPELARHYVGLRHDSGDPLVWAEQALAHYARLGLDARNKRLVFSDGLDTARAIALYRALRTRAQLAFGIGTHLTHDTGLPPLNIVMKLIRVNGQPVAKLSDSPGKTLCDDPAFVQRLHQTFAAVAGMQPA